MAQVRHIARLEYGSSLPVGDRIEGDVAVFGSNGPVGQHNSGNTDSPVVVVGRKGSHGKLQYSSNPVFAIDTTYFIDPGSTQAHIRWLYYALSTLELDKTGQDVGVPGLSREYAYSRRLPLPSPTEQRAIADYLDTETSRIDTLITKKRRMIELLDERLHRFAVALLTAEGREDRWSPGPCWLGSVPRAWKPHKIAWTKQTASGTTPESGNPRYYDTTGVPWITTSELRETTILDASRRVTSDAFLDYSALKVFASGTVLIAMYGATVGRLGVLGVQAATNQACCAVYGEGLLDQRFLYWWLWANRNNLISMAYGSGQPNISQDIVRGLRVPAPEVSEQRRIADRIDSEVAQTERAKWKLNRLIALLNERRQALITATVTGEFPVPADRG